MINASYLMSGGVEPPVAKHNSVTVTPFRNTVNGKHSGPQFVENFCFTKDPRSTSERAAAKHKAALKQKEALNTEAGIVPSGGP